MFRGHCLLVLLLSVSILALGRGPVAQLEEGVSADRATGLMWVADGNHIVSSGLVRDMVMPRSEALTVIEALNAGEIENFGFTDWRLPTRRELTYIFAQNDLRLDKVRGYMQGAKSSERSGHEGRLAHAKAGPGGSGESKDGDANAEDSVVVWPVRGGSTGGFESAVVFALNSIALKEHVEVISGDVVANEASVDPTLGPDVELDLGNHVVTPEGYAVKADSIRFKNHTTVNGDIHYNDLTGNGNINGNEITPLALPVFDSIPIFISPPSDIISADDVNVRPNKSLVLAPGDYRDLRVWSRATVVFTGGVYNFNDVAFANNTQLVFQGPTEVRIAKRFALGNNSYIGPAPGASVLASEAVFYVKGGNGASGTLGDTPETVDIGTGNEIFANFYAPNGTLHIRNHTDATGAFLGRDVLVQNGATLTLDSAFTNDPPIAGDDLIRVNIGGIATTLDSGHTSLLANDTDPNPDDVLTVTTTPISGPDHGTLVLNADGTFIYTHDGGSSLSDSFVYEVCDNGSPVLCDTGTVDIIVNPNAVTVSITKSGTGTGTVTSLPVGLNCGNICVNTFATTEAIFLEATPDAGSVFAGWAGDADCLDGQLAPFGNKNCEAIFNLAPPPPDPIKVTIEKAGEGSGTVTSLPSGLNCGTRCSADFPEFTRIELTATPNDGSVFAGWSGALDCLDGRLNGAEDTTCIATFELAPPPPETHTVRVIVLGTGGGTVTSNPVGLFCVDDCSLEFEAGIGLTLLGRPDGGSQFVAWGGDCSGTGFSTFITVDSDKTCTATFDSTQ